MALLEPLKEINENPTSENIANVQRNKHYNNDIRL